MLLSGLPVDGKYLLSYCKEILLVRKMVRKNITNFNNYSALELHHHLELLAFYELVLVQSMTLRLDPRKLPH